MDEQAALNSNNQDNQVAKQPVDAGRKVELEAQVNNLAQRLQSASTKDEIDQIRSEFKSLLSEAKNFQISTSAVDQAINAAQVRVVEAEVAAKQEITGAVGDKIAEQKQAEKDLQNAEKQTQETNPYSKMSSEEISKDLEMRYERSMKNHDNLLEKLDSISKKEEVTKEDALSLQEDIQKDNENKDIENSILAIAEKTQRCEKNRARIKRFKSDMEKENEEGKQFLAKDVEELQKEIDEEEKAILEEKDNLKKLFDTQDIKLEKFVELSNDPKLKGEDAKNIIDDIVSKFAEKKKEDIAILEKNNIELNEISARENSKNKEQNVDKEKSDLVATPKETQLHENKVNPKDENAQLDNTNKANITNPQEKQKDNDENIKSQFKSFKNLAEEKKHFAKMVHQIITGENYWTKKRASSSRAIEENVDRDTKNKKENVDRNKKNTWER